MPRKADIAAAMKAGQRGAAAKLRAQAIKGAAPRVPYKVTAGGAQCVVQSIEQKDNKVILTVDMKRGGKTVPFSNPWVIVNPPVVVVDKRGDIIATEVDPATGKTVETRFRYDPWGAIDELIRETLAALK